MIARAVHFESDLDIASLMTTVDNNRYLNALSWEWSSTGNDSIWLNTFDFAKLQKTNSEPVLVIQNEFDLGDNVDGVVLAATIDNAVAFCYADESNYLQLALWESDDEDSLYKASMLHGANNLLHKGCASIELTETYSTLRKIIAVVYTTDNQLAYVTLQIVGAEKFSVTESTQKPC